MLNNAFAGFARAISSAMGGPYQEATLERRAAPQFDDGGSIIAPGALETSACLVQIDDLTRDMRADADFVEGDVRLIILADGLEFVPNTDSKVAGYSIRSVSSDPMGIGYVCRGRPV
jgi:hypothetical protein